jgi:DNA-binding NarL/FixJ family response regulator
MDRHALVLIVARPGRLRDGWRALLLSMPQIESVSLADDTATALRLARIQRPKLTLIEVEPFGDEAWSLIKQMTAEQPDCLSIVLAGDMEELRAAQSNGASAALIKGFPAAGLFDIVGQLLPEQ